MKLIDTEVILNEDFLPNSNLTYDIYYDDNVNFEARLNESGNKGRVGVKDAPKVLRYTLDKPLDKFTREEIDQVLNYRGLCFEHDGFEASDVFMEKSFITLVEETFSMNILRQELEKLKSNVIGIFKTAENSHELVVAYCPKEEVINTIKVTNFAIIQESFNVPTRFGELYLFKDNKTMNEVLKNPYEWAEFMEQFKTK